MKQLKLFEYLCGECGWRGGGDPALPGIESWACPECGAWAKNKYVLARKIKWEDFVEEIVRSVER